MSSESTGQTLYRFVQLLGQIGEESDLTRENLFGEPNSTMPLILLAWIPLCSSGRFLIRSPMSNRDLQLEDLGISKRIDEVWPAWSM